MRGHTICFGEMVLMRGHYMFGETVFIRGHTMFR